MFIGDIYNNIGNKDGIFAKICGVGPFYLTFITENTRFSDKRGKLFDSFLFQHNTSLNEAVADNSFTVSRQTNNVKDLYVGIKKKVNTNEYFLYANRTGIIYINKIGAGANVEIIKQISIKENSTDEYETVSLTDYSMFYLNGNEDKLQNVEAGTLFYDSNNNSLKYNIWGINDPQKNIDWFYFERNHYRKFITEKTTFKLGSTYNNCICEFSLINRFEKEYIDKLKISISGYWGNEYIDIVKASFQSYTDDKYFKIFIKNHNVYITFDSHVYISCNKFIGKADVDLTDAIEVNVITNLVSSDSLPALYNTKGKAFYCKDLNKPLWFNGSRYLDALGNVAKITKGNTSQRPSLNEESEGFEYYDTSLKKKILWNGTTWVNIDGSSLDIKKIGATDVRPTNIDIGFIYKDTTLNKLILWEGTKWINLDGTDLT